MRRLRGPGHDGYFAVLRSSGALVDVINLSEIVRGSFQSAYLGYYAFAPHAGRGHVSEGLRLVLRPAFGRLGLHRVEGSIQPGNMARALVRPVGDPARKVDRFGDTVWYVRSAREEG